MVGVFVGASMASQKVDSPSGKPASAMVGPSGNAAGAGQLSTMTGWPKAVGSR